MNDKEKIEDLTKIELAAGCSLSLLFFIAVVISGAMLLISILTNLDLG